MSERKTSPANAALVRQASGPPDPSVPPWPLTVTVDLREDPPSPSSALWLHRPWHRQAPRAASAGTDSQQAWSPSGPQPRGGSLPPSNLTRASPIRFRQCTTTLNGRGKANGRAPLSPTTDGGHGGKELLPPPSTPLRCCRPSRSLTGPGPDLSGSTLRLLGSRTRPGARISRSPTPRQDHVLLSPRPCLFRPTRPHPILACPPCSVHSVTMAFISSICHPFQPYFAQLQT